MIGKTQIAQVKANFAKGWEIVLLPISNRVIGCALKVHRCLGPGFLEAVYENSLAMEMAESGIDFQTQVAIPVHYNERLAGRYFADFIVDDLLLLEIKSSSCLLAAHSNQLLHYLRATGLSVGLLLNFGASSLQIKRLVNNFDDKQII
jgi:GxxExxY protein